jgi:hypothetical protein
MVVVAAFSSQEPLVKFHQPLRKDNISQNLVLGGHSAAGNGKFAGGNRVLDGVGRIEAAVGVDAAEEFRPRDLNVLTRKEAGNIEIALLIEPVPQGACVAEDGVGAEQFSEGFGAQVERITSGSEAGG